MGVSIPFDGAVHPVLAVRPWCRRRTSERRWPAFCSDRYGVYKKLARQREGRNWPFRWAHVRREPFAPWPRRGPSGRAGR